MDGIEYILFLLALVTHVCRQCCCRLTCEIPANIQQPGLSIKILMSCSLPLEDVKAGMMFGRVLFIYYYFFVIGNNKQQQQKRLFRHDKIIRLQQISDGVSRRFLKGIIFLFFIYLFIIIIFCGDENKGDNLLLQSVTA